MTDRVFRWILAFAAAANLGAALLFAFPAQPLGALAGLPPEVPLLYRALVALFIMLFGGMYAWLASQPVIQRPMVALAAIGKSGAFLCVFALWLGSAVPLRSALLMSADLVLAALFLLWLRGWR